jgi:hypothetical protein
MNKKPKIVRFSDLPEPEPIDTSQAIPDSEVTWERILAEEPEVERVLAELGSTPRGRRYARWHLFVANHGTTPKAYLSKLVGWHARNPKLRSQEAYRLTMDHMWEVV